MGEGAAFQLSSDTSSVVAPSVNSMIVLQIILGKAIGAGHLSVALPGNIIKIHCPALPQLHFAPFLRLFVTSKLTYCAFFFIIRPARI